jgi:hypothetical protein
LHIRVNKSSMHYIADFKIAFATGNIHQNLH